MTEAEERLIKAALVYTGNIAGGLTLEFVDAANAVRAERQPSPYAGPSFTHQQWRELYSAPLGGNDLRVATAAEHETIVDFLAKVLPDV